jgi:hypothetical protein
LFKPKKNLSLKKSKGIAENKKKQKVQKSRKRSVSKGKTSSKGKNKKKAKKKTKKRKIKIKKIKEPKHTNISLQSNVVIPDKSEQSKSSKISRSDNLLTMDEFKQALIHEDIFNEKKTILPFLKYLENKDIFSHYFEEDFEASRDSIIKNKNKIQISHGEIFHFLLLTNKFMSKETKY